MRCKNHVKKKYKGIQIDVYHGMNGAWYAYIPNRVKYVYKTADMKTKDMVVRDCQNYIDKNMA